MKTLDRKLLKKFLKLAGEHLTGRWILVGGTILPILGINHRSTTDIDLVGLGKEEQAQSLKLMELAEKLDLPIETINQAASYFVRKVPAYEEHLVILHKGKHCTIYRPDLWLYIYLKTQRLTDSDLQDCVEYIKYSLKNEKGLNASLVLNYLDTQAHLEKNPEKKKKLREIARLLKDLLEE